MDSGRNLEQKQDFLMAFLLKTRNNKDDEPSSSSSPTPVVMQNEQSAAIDAGYTPSNAEPDGPETVTPRVQEILPFYGVSPHVIQQYSVDASREGSLIGEGSELSNMDEDNPEPWGVIRENSSPSTTNTRHRERDFILSRRQHLESVLSHIVVHHIHNLRHPKPNIETLDEKIRKLLTVTISAENIEKEDLCSVCMESYILNEEVKKLSCGHLFHVECITPWFKRNQTCPVCRKYLKEMKERPRARLFRRLHRAYPSFPDLLPTHSFNSV